MPLPAKLEKARLFKIKWLKDKPSPEILGEPLVVQFNPQTLNIGFSNQIAGNGQGGGSPRQFVGKGTTTLSLELWFDVTAPTLGRVGIDRGQAKLNYRGQAKFDSDVRELTREVIYFITPQKTNEANKYLTPGIRFAWGTFLFDGIITTMNETLEFFSEDGKPLRSKIDFSIIQQEIKLPETGKDAASRLGLSLNAGIGTTPLVQAQAGVSIQDIAATHGHVSNWKAIALANNIENPRKIAAGTLINANVSGNFKMEL